MVQSFSLRMNLTNSPFLTSGEGFEGETEQPADVGGSSVETMALFDVVPWTANTHTLYIGVVAFHQSGINRVEFSAEDGAWIAVGSMTRNPHTDVVEYTVGMRASQFTPGIVEVRAIAYPNAGRPRVLTTYIFANPGSPLPAPVAYVALDGNDTTGNGTSGTPYATITKAANRITTAYGSTSNATIYCKAGSHEIPGATFGNESAAGDGWMTITRAPGLVPSDVVITGTTGSGLNNAKVKFLGVTISGVIKSGNITDYLWFDECHFAGPGRTLSTINADGSWTAKWLTNSTMADMSDGASGYTIVRNVQLQRIGGDSFSNSSLVINSSVETVDPSTEAGIFHPDIWQFTGTASNVIIYGVTATEEIGTLTPDSGVQGYTFNNPPTCVAIVNCSTVPKNQINGEISNFYIKNTTGWWVFGMGGDVPIATDVVFEGVTFLGAPPPATSGVTIR